MGLIVCMLLWMAALRRGLFYASDVYGILLMACAGALLAFIFVSYYVHQMKSKRRLPNINEFGLAQSEDKSIQLPALGYFSWTLWPLGMMVCFALHALTGSHSTQGSLDEMLRWSLLAIFALLVAILAWLPQGAGWFRLGWQITGGVLVLSGILTVCGIMPLPFGVMRTADPEISSAGARLGGLLQYPNAYGAVVGMYALERLDAAARVIGWRPPHGVQPGAAQPPRTWQLIAAAAPLMPAIAALLLSESRGAWLATGCAAGCAFALQRRAFRLPLLLATAAPLASAAWLHRQLAAAQLAPAPVPGLLALAGAWAAALLGTLLLCRLWHGSASSRAAALTATALAAVAAAALAVTSTAERLAAGVGTGLSRLRMWQDALKLWTEAAWLGHGGETWRGMYRAIQSSPYVGGEVHSGILDLALDAGIIGLVLVVLWFISTIRIVWRNATHLVPCILVFGLHGAIDFDWSFTLLWMMFIWIGGWAYALQFNMHQTLGAQSSVYSPKGRSLEHSQAVSPFGCSTKLIPSRQHEWGKAKHGEAYSQTVFSRYRYEIGDLIHKYQMVNIWTTTGLIVLTAICWIGGIAWLAGQQMAAEMHYRQVVQSTDLSEEQAQILIQASRANPYRSDIAITLARLLPVVDAEKMLRQSLSHTQSDAGMYFELGQLAAQSLKSEQAIHYFNEAIALNRYDATFHFGAVYWMQQIAQQELRAGQLDQARQTAAAGVHIVERYRRLVEAVVMSNDRNDRRFVLQPAATIYEDRLRTMADEAYFSKDSSSVR
nr:O-antigen ligase family protein [Paenibacillus xylanexedens]